MRFLQFINILSQNHTGIMLERIELDLKIQTYRMELNALIRGNQTLERIFNNLILLVDKLLACIGH
jgi:hypothetical protein